MKQKKDALQIYETSTSGEFHKRMLHDYGNHLNCIQGLLKEKQYDKAQKYAEQLTESIYEGMEVVNVQHAVINAILNQKYHLAEKKGIVISFQFNNLSNIWLEEPDLVILISNLLDNAMEASDKSKEKMIYIKIVLEKSQMVLSIKNTTGEPVVIEDNGIHTSKMDQNRHGIGLKNVQMVLDKYDGMGMMRYEEGWFYYTAIIPK